METFVKKKLKKNVFNLMKNYKSISLSIFSLIKVSKILDILMGFLKKLHINFQTISERNQSFWASAHF